MSFKSKIRKIKNKSVVYSYYLDGSFDRKDKNRLKPLSRLRSSENECKKETSGDVRLRIKDWFDDIERGYCK